MLCKRDVCVNIQETVALTGLSEGLVFIEYTLSLFFLLEIVGQNTCGHYFVGQITHPTSFVEFIHKYILIYFKLFTRGLTTEYG